MGGGGRLSRWVPRGRGGAAWQAEAWSKAWPSFHSATDVADLGRLATKH